MATLLGAHLDSTSAIAIAGEAAAAVGERLARAGGPPLTVEADRFALLSDDLDPPKAGRVRDLPESSLDAVVLRRAWADPSDIQQALETAIRVVRPGGEVIAADVDADRMIEGPSFRYPAGVLYRREPEAARRLRDSSASAALLGLAAVRAGFAELEAASYDDVRGEHDDVAGLWAALREGGWRGSIWVASDRLGPLFESATGDLTAAVPAGPAVDREPWHAVVGRVR